MRFLVLTLLLASAPLQAQPAPPDTEELERELKRLVEVFTLASENAADLQSADRLIYAGAIDSIPSPDPADIAGADNYVRKALDEALAGQPVSVPSTASYGCSVKYD